MNEYEKTITAVYDDCVKRGTIKEVPLKKQNELIEKFLQFYKKFDKRLLNINRDKIVVRYNENGKIDVNCCYYNKFYRQVYEA